MSTSPELKSASDSSKSYDEVLILRRSTLKHLEPGIPISPTDWNIIAYILIKMLEGLKYIVMPVAGTDGSSGSESSRVVRPYSDSGESNESSALVLGVLDQAGGGDESLIQ